MRKQSNEPFSASRPSNARDSAGNPGRGSQSDDDLLGPLPDSFSAAEPLDVTLDWEGHQARPKVSEPDFDAVHSELTGTPFPPRKVGSRPPMAPFSAARTQIGLPSPKYSNDAKLPPTNPPPPPQDAG